MVVIEMQWADHDGWDLSSYESLKYWALELEKLPSSNVLRGVIKELTDIDHEIKELDPSESSESESSEDPGDPEEPVEEEAAPPPALPSIRIKTRSEVAASAVPAPASPTTSRKGGKGKGVEVASPPHYVNDPPVSVISLFVQCSSWLIN